MLDFNYILVWVEELQMESWIKFKVNLFANDIQYFTDWEVKSFKFNTLTNDYNKLFPQIIQMQFQVLLIIFIHLKKFVNLLFIIDRGIHNFLFNIEPWINWQLRGTFELISQLSYIIILVRQLAKLQEVELFRHTCLI